MSRVLAYCRQSIESEGGEHSLSIDSQVTALTDRCRREGWTLVGAVRESGLKGYQDVDERPGMAEAISRAEAGDYNVLLVWDLSRLARSLRLQEQWFWQFSRYGVEIVSHSEPESADILLRQVKGAFAEHRTREIASHVRRALRENTRRGIPHGSAPYGYSRGESRVLVPSDDAGTVRRIFQWRVGGRTLGEIAEQLRREDIAGPSGGTWYRTTLTQLLGNPVYRGALHLAEVTVDGVHPAIIDAELWQRAQDIASSRPRSPRTKAARSWLEGLLEHACGCPMYLVGGSAGYPSLVFRCRVGGGWAHPDTTCASQPRQIAADRVEALAWDAVSAAFLALPRSPRGTITAAQARYRQMMPTADAALRVATERKSKAVARRERVIELYLSGAIDNARMTRELAQVAQEESETDAALSQLPSPPDPAAIEAAWLALREIRRGIADFTEDERALCLRRIGVAVLSPAGVALVTGRRGPRPDTGRVEIRFRREYALLFG